MRRLFKNKKNISPPESESYPAAVIFADISGFTPLTEKLANRGLEGIEQLTTELNTYFKKYSFHFRNTHLFTQFILID